MAANEIEIDDDLIQAVLDGNKTQLRIPLGNTSNFGMNTLLLATDFKVDSKGFLWCLTHGEFGYQETPIKCPCVLPGKIANVKNTDIKIMIVSVGFDRIQNITHEDAISEGCPIFYNSETGFVEMLTNHSFPEHWVEDLYEKKYQGCWSDNEFVWVIEFRLFRETVCQLCGGSGQLEYETNCPNCNVAQLVVELPEDTSTDKSGNNRKPALSWSAFENIYYSQDHNGCMLPIYVGKRPNGWTAKLAGRHEPGGIFKTVEEAQLACEDYYEKETDDIAKVNALLKENRTKQS